MMTSCTLHIFFLFSFINFYCHAHKTYSAVFFLHKHNNYDNMEMFTGPSCMQHTPLLHGRAKQEKKVRRKRVFVFPLSPFSNFNACLGFSSKNENTVVELNLSHHPTPNNITKSGWNHVTTNL